jgi:PhnB protein
MTSRLNPYLSFIDTAEEAMEFYRSVFGGQLQVHTFGDMGDPEGAEAHKVMHAMLETDLGFTLMASDTPEGMPPSPGNGTISVSGDDAEVLRGYWAALSEDGQVTMPLERQVWGDDFGMVTDRFGVSWMVSIAPQQA